MIPVEARAGLQALLEDRVVFDVPMARQTSLRVGGPADALATPQDRTELAARKRGWNGDLRHAWRLDCG